MRKKNLPRINADNADFSLIYPRYPRLSAAKKIWIY